MDSKNIESIFPLTPLQQAFLWHGVGSSARVGLLQMRCRIDGHLDVMRFEQAWQAVTQRHATLRSAVVWRDVKKPMQVVMRRVPLRWVFHDWHAAADAPARVAAFVEQDAREPLDLVSAPVFRVALLRVAETAYELVWTCHHVLLDGWSGGLVLDEVFRLAAGDDAQADGIAQAHSDAGSAPGFQDYALWLRGRDRQGAQAYWCEKLAGMTSMTPLPDTVAPHDQTPMVAANGDGSAACTAQLRLDEAATATLNAFARAHRLTLTTLVQAAWSLVLARAGAGTDVMFGVTVSGRQATLPGVERIVGMLINVLPVRVRLDPGFATIAWLQALQADSFATLPHAWVDPGQMLAWCPHGHALFDSLLVIENQPAPARHRSLAISGQRSGIVSRFPMTVVVKPLACLEVQITDLRPGSQLARLGQVLDDLRAMLAQMSDGTAIHLRDLLGSDGGDVGGGKPGVATARLQASPVPAPVMPVLPALPPAPASLEAQLTQLWQEILGVAPIGPDDRFFDLGGTSLHAMALFARIGSLYGQSLPPTTLFQADTVATLARLLRRADPLASWSTVVAIQSLGEAPPLFIVDTTTDMLVYRALAARLGASQPVYGLRGRELDDQPALAVANHLADQLEAMHPDGPCFLAGLSGGGSMAWLMAQRLQARGRTVGLLVLFDCLGPDYPHLLPPMSRFLAFCKDYAASVVRHLRARSHPVAGAMVATGGAVSSPPAAVRAPAPSLVERLRTAKPLVHEIVQGRGRLAALVDLAILLLIKLPPYRNVLGLSVLLQGIWIERIDSADRAVAASAGDLSLGRAGQTYERLYADLKPWSGPIVFFRARRRQPGVVVDPLVGWGALAADNLRVHEVDGNHLSLLEEPHVQALADILRHELNAARGTAVPRAATIDPATDTLISHGGISA